jgi:cytochrome c peroxidase
MRSKKECTMSRFTHRRRNRIPWSARTSVVAGVLLSNLSLAQGDLDSQLKSVLAAADFTGQVESSLEGRLGRRLDPKLADLGRLLWFDPAG